MKKYKVGYTQGVFDLFHIGHLNYLKNAKEQCDYLIVGVNSDNLVLEYKNKIPTINEKERLEIVDAIKYVDKTILVNTLDKKEIYKDYKFDVIFAGGDWIGNPRWEQTKIDFNKIGVDVLFLKRTDGISTSMIDEKIRSKNK